MRIAASEFAGERCRMILRCTLTLGGVRKSTVLCGSQRKGTLRGGFAYSNEWRR